MKRASAILLFIFIIVEIVMAFYYGELYTPNKKIGDYAIQRDYRNDTITYLDDEAIALADEYNDVGLRSEALKAYNIINSIREEAGLNTLVWDSDLESTSMVRSKEISREFSHTRPNGLQWYTVNSTIMAGENLAYGYNHSEEVVDGWMESPTHRDNILYPTFTKIAISIYVENGVYYWAQEFGY